MKFEAYVAGGVEYDKVMLERLAKTFGGFTITPAFGGWLNKDRELVLERSAVVTVLVPTDEPMSIEEQTQAAIMFEQTVLAAAARAGEVEVGFVGDAMAHDVRFVSTGVSVGRA